MTTLIEISYISQAISSAAVVASLVFVGVQLRRNTKATRAASHHAITEALNHVNLVWARDPELARIWLDGKEDRQSLNAEERWRFDLILRAYLHVCETMYTQAALGAGDASIVRAEELGINHIFQSEGVKQWWRENPFGFSPKFRSYIDTVSRVLASAA